MHVDDLPGQGKADAGFSAFSHVEASGQMPLAVHGDAVPGILCVSSLRLYRAASQAQLAASIAYHWMGCGDALAGIRYHHSL